MKNFLKSACFFMHLILIAIMEFAIVVGIVNYIAETTNYYGIGNVFVLIAVGAVWFTSYVAFAKECERRKN